MDEQRKKALDAALAQIERQFGPNALAAMSGAKPDKMVGKEVSLAQRFSGFVKYFDGICPQCLAEGNTVDMWLNSGDLFECPDCALLVAMAPLQRSVILRRRGNGNFKSNRSNPVFNAARSRRFHGSIFVRESLEETYEPDKFNTIETAEQFASYYPDINGIDPYC